MIIINHSHYIILQVQPLTRLAVKAVPKLVESQKCNPTNQNEKRTQLMLACQNLYKWEFYDKIFATVVCAYKMYISVLKHCNNTKSQLQNGRYIGINTDCPMPTPHYRCQCLNQNIMYCVTSKYKYAVNRRGEAESIHAS